MKKKRIGQKAKLSTPTQAIDERIGDEEQKEEQRKETGSGTPTQLPGPFGRLLRLSWIIWWAYSGNDNNIMKIYLLKLGSNVVE